MASFQLNLEDLKNRSRRKSLSIRGLPEAVAHRDLQATMVRLFNRLLSEPVSNHIEMDRIHRVPNPRGMDNSTPRDVLCRTHFLYY